MALSPEAIKRALQLWARMEPESFADALRHEYLSDPEPRPTMVRQGTRYVFIYPDKKETTR